MRRRKRLFFPERHSDEQSLYYALERDLDREALFRENDGWIRQFSLGRHKTVDYVVGYGKRVFGIEVKSGYPKPKHFEQASRYGRTLSGIFLAYPSDRAGEAVFVSRDNPQHAGVGLISITAFRSYVIRTAKCNKKQGANIWRDQFRPASILRDDWGSLTKEDTLPGTILKDGRYWVSLGQTGNHYPDNPLHYELPESFWRGLALLYVGGLITGYRKFLSDDCLGKLRDDMDWGTYDTWTLVKYGLAYYRSYGDSLPVYNLTNSTWRLGRDLVRTLRHKIGEDQWRLLLSRKKDWKKEHGRKQSENLPTFSRRAQRKS